MKSFILALFPFVVASTVVPDLSAQEVPAVAPEPEGHRFFYQFFKPHKASVPKQTTVETWAIHVASAQ